MSKLWEDLKDNMKEWGTSAVEKAEEISRVAVAKGEEFTKISKIKIDIHQLQREKSKIYENLGKFTYHQAQDENLANFTGNTEFFLTISKIHQINKQIVEKELEIEQIKDEYGLQDQDIEDAGGNESENIPHYKETSIKTPDENKESISE